MHNPFSLEGKTILITGASSGIGQSIAIECSKMGATIIITGRNEKKLQETLAQLDQNKRHVLFVTDLTDDNEVDQFVQNLPPINGFVNSAGILKKLPFKFAKRLHFNEIMDTNFLAPALLLQKIYKKGLLLNDGSVVFISSIASNVASIGNISYMASKGAINSLARGLALELSPKKIRVNCIEPALILTDLSKNALGKEELASYEKRFPLGRFGKTEEVAYAAIYLLSDASSWTTGTVITIDGGITLNG